MKTILLTNKYDGIPLSIVEEEFPQGFTIRFLSSQTQEALRKESADADYILAGGRLKITREVLENAKKLKMIQRSGVGLDAMDLDAIKEKGIPLYVNQGVNAESVAEHTLLLMLACLRKLPAINQRTKEGIWKKQEQGIQTTELRGKTVGIIGMGHIARALAELLKPFHVKILYFDIKKVSSESEDEYHMEFAELNRLISESDILTIHCALTDETKNLFNTETISRMKQGSVLINTSRGGMVDPFALSESLKKGHLSYAALDVHIQEPIPDDYPLKNVENVILTPHIAGITADSFRKMMHEAFRNIVSFDQGYFEEIEANKYI